MPHYPWVEFVGVSLRLGWHLGQWGFFRLMLSYRHFWIRPWQPQDRDGVVALIAMVLKEFGLAWQPEGADADVVAVEQFYRARGGEFWVVEQNQVIVGTAAYYPINRGGKAVEIRKMYLHPQARGQGLGQFLLTQLEQRIQAQGFQLIWIETATIMNQAVRLYEKNGYQPTTGVETQRCDRVYFKQVAYNESNDSSLSL